MLFSGVSSSIHHILKRYVSKKTTYPLPELLSATDIAAELQVCRATSFILLKYTPGVVVIDNPLCEASRIVKITYKGHKRVKRMPREVFIELQKRLQAEELQKTLNTESNNAI